MNEAQANEHYKLDKRVHCKYQLHGKVKTELLTLSLFGITVSVALPKPDPSRLDLTLPRR